MPTGGIMIITNLLQPGFLDLAPFVVTTDRAARMKFTAGWKIQWLRYVSCDGI